MQIVQKKGFYYLSHTFRKKGRPVNRYKYIGKSVPSNLEMIKERFLRECMQEELFLKLNRIKKRFNSEWNAFPESVKKRNIIDSAIIFTYNTNAIEGSTITLDETEDLIKRRLSPNKSLDDVQETIKHVDVFFKVINEKRELSLLLILEWHRELFESTKPDIAGKIREYLVRVGGYLAPDWQDIPKLLKDFFEWFSSNKKIMHPVELAARAHYKFEKMHPFGDGNGRIGRLIIIYILRKANFPIFAIEYVKRKRYYNALRKDENYFVRYLIKRYLSENKRFIHNLKI